MRPYASATTAIATPPTRPPTTPADSGWTWTGSRVRCPPSPSLSRPTAVLDGAIGLARSASGRSGTCSETLLVLDREQAFGV